SIGARTAHVSQPYVDATAAPEHGPEHGVAYFETGALTDFLQEAHAAGLQVGLHAIGDEAIEQALTAWERVHQGLDSRLRRHFRARGHRLEHFEMPSPRHLDRVAMLGLAVSVQPAFDAAWGNSGQLYEQRLGEERALAMNPFRSLMDRGVIVGAGSDAPITPLDPFAGVHALQFHHDPGQRLTREDALRMFTVGGAALAHLDDKKGRLRPGMHADFAVYPDDPSTVEDPASLRPILTVSLGREVFVA
ncbi:MAG: amidohydrolase family protein, partial [Actinomycetota bacterium]